jgi:hypothetical protein
MPAPKRRRWFSLSLRTVLIGMTVLSVGFWWFLHYRREKVAERGRIEAKYDAFEFGESLLGWELPAAPAADSSDPWKWLRFLATPEVRRVDLSTNDPNTEEFLSLVRQASVVRVNREHWMGDVTRCLSSNTRELDVWGGFLQSQDLTDLSAAPYLRKLHCEPPLSAAGVRAVLSHRALEDVSLPGTGMPGDVSSHRP